MKAGLIICLHILRSDLHPLTWPEIAFFTTKFTWQSYLLLFWNVSRWWLINHLKRETIFFFLIFWLHSMLKVTLLDADRNLESFNYNTVSSTVHFSLQFKISASLFLKFCINLDNFSSWIMKQTCFGLVHPEYRPDCIETWRSEIARIRNWFHNLISKKVGHG